MGEGWGTLGEQAEISLPWGGERGCYPAHQIRALSNQPFWVVLKVETFLR